MDRTELACHTGYSTMNGLGLAGDWVSFAAREGIKTLVITDYGNMDSYGQVEWEIERSKEDIKLIMGTDIKVFDDRKGSKSARKEGRLTLLIRNETGRKNLNRILSEGEMEHKKDDDSEIIVPLSLVLDHREGLLIGSGTDESLLISYIGDDLEGILDELGKKAEKGFFNFLDYIEIPVEKVNDYSDELLLKIAEHYGIPAAAVSAPHYPEKNYMEAYSVLKGAPESGEKHYMSTEEMLTLFDRFGSEKAYELVVTNTRLIASLCETVPSVPFKKAYPYIDDQDEKLKEICLKALPQKYPDAGDDIKARLDWELNAIKKSRSAFMFLDAAAVIKELGLRPYEVSYRGQVGASIVAYLSGITEVDPVKAKLSPYFFFGFNGDREPDIDLNFSPLLRERMPEIYKKLPGVGEVINAGTICFVSGKLASELMDRYSIAYGLEIKGVKAEKMAEKLTRCVAGRGVHPGGLFLVPEGSEVTDICPVKKLVRDGRTVITNGFDYHNVDGALYKADALFHQTVKMIGELSKLTGRDPLRISTTDLEVLYMFKSTRDELPACAGIPDFNLESTLIALKDFHAQSFENLVKFESLMHGTGTWIDNADVLLESGRAGIREIPATRDDVFDTLTGYGLDGETAYLITEDVRKGKVSTGRSKMWPEWVKIMEEHGVPDWFMWSCEKIKYMFPRAHCHIYMLNAWRMAWYKLHFPVEYKKVMKDNGFEENTGRVSEDSEKRFFS